MDHRTTINDEVSITAVYFRNKHHLKSFPKRMEYAGRQYEFIESGLQYRIKKPGGELRLFDMSDGSAQYRLRFDRRSLTWTLVSITKILNFSN
ncbi:MAG TPA: hypothetical protein VMR18_04280 [Candidatus Saccharimonadales bacterium]|nr:hypothetical protein [Candidatus Saccharimonadales bacterium]